MKRLSLIVAIAALTSSTWLHAGQPANSAITEAAMAGDTAAVKRLLKEGADANTASPDGMTPLHWAAMKGVPDLAQALLVSGANIEAKTRLGAFTPLHLASQAGHAMVIAHLIASGAKVDATTATGATALMHAASSGNAQAVTMLIENGAKTDATESANGQTALMFAAALNRAEATQALLTRAANPSATSKVVNLAALTASDDSSTQSPPPGVPAPAARPAQAEVPGLTRAFNYNELIGQVGGLSALHFAARQGAADVVKVLVEGGAKANLPSAGDGTSPVLIAVINGHFDIARYLLEHGADASAANAAGVTPLYAAVNLQWAPKSFYPQPRAYLQQHTGYLELMTMLLDKGADPNARVNRKTWFTQYNFDLLRVDDGGATPFWRAAYASDLEAMKLLVARGADPFIPTAKPAGNNRPQQGGTRSESDVTVPLPPLPTGGPAITALHAAAGVGFGEGFAGNAHRAAPTGMVAAVKYLVEELGLDVNAVDDDGNTAVHHAASRGDNEMILYLVSKGADVKRVNRIGQTTVDLANGPVQRTQPFPETIKLLESLGAKNNNKCVSC